MIFFLYGDNSYRALNKIADVKSAFYKKGKKNIAIAEIDSTRATIDSIIESLGAGSLFAEQRLVVLRQAFATYPQLLGFVKEKGEALKVSRDVFIFWERHISDKNKEDILREFKKNAEKIEETNARTREELNQWLQKEANERKLTLSAMQRNAMIDSQSFADGDSPEWAIIQELEKMTLGAEIDISSTNKSAPPAQNLIFSFVDKIFGNKLFRGLIAFRQAKKEGIDEADLLRMLLWKLKNIFLVKSGEEKKLNFYVAQKTAVDAAQFDRQGILDSFWAGILADSALKRDSKNQDEHIESFMLSMKSKTQ